MPGSLHGPHHEEWAKHRKTVPEMPKKMSQSTKGGNRGMEEKMSTCPIPTTDHWQGEETQKEGQSPGGDGEHEHLLPFSAKHSQ